MPLLFPPTAMGLAHLLKKMVEDDDNKNRKVKQRLKLNPAQKKMWKELSEVSAKAREFEAKRLILKKQFWADVSIASGLYAEDMKYDDKLEEVIVYEDEDDDE